MTKRSRYEEKNSTLNRRRSYRQHEDTTTACTNYFLILRLSYYWLPFVWLMKVCCSESVLSVFVLQLSQNAKETRHSFCPVIQLFSAVNVEVAVVDLKVRSVTLKTHFISYCIIKMIIFPNDQSFTSYQLSSFHMRIHKFKVYHCTVTVGYYYFLVLWLCDCHNNNNNNNSNNNNNNNNNNDDDDDDDNNKEYLQNSTIYRK